MFMGHFWVCHHNPPFFPIVQCGQCGLDTNTFSSSSPWHLPPLSRIITHEETDSSSKLQNILKNSHIFKNFGMIITLCYRDSLIYSFSEKSLTLHRFIEGRGEEKDCSYPQPCLCSACSRLWPSPTVSVWPLQGTPAPACPGPSARGGAGPSQVSRGHVSHCHLCNWLWLVLQKVPSEGS